MMGDAVTITGRHAEALAETDNGRGMTCRTSDITDEASVNALFDTPFDVVVANAGTGKVGKVKKDQSRRLERPTRGQPDRPHSWTFRGALQGMETGGRLIAIASVASLKGQANIAAYSAAKHGVLGLVRSLAHEVARDGITVNAVCPHYVDTPMADRAAGRRSREVRHDPRTRPSRKLVADNPVGRLISVDEVASAVRYLASPRCRDDQWPRAVHVRWHGMSAAYKPRLPPLAAPAENHPVDRG